MDEALVEHTAAKDLIAQLKEMDPEYDLYDAKVTILGEQIDHHVKEEEGDIFVKAKAAKVDLVTLGAKMAKRKAELMNRKAMWQEQRESRPNRRRRPPPRYERLGIVRPLLASINKIRLLVAG